MPTHEMMVGPLAVLVWSATHHSTSCLKTSVTTILSQQDTHVTSLIITELPYR